MNILVLENDRLLNWAISFSLQKENHTVFKCFNESDAKLVLEEQQIDMIISELIIEKKTELNFLPFLKEAIEFNIPIIIISEVLYDPKIIEQHKLNCVAFFSKPIDPFLIIDEVNRISKTKKAKKLSNHENKF